MRVCMQAGLTACASCMAPAGVICILFTIHCAVTHVTIVSHDGALRLGDTLAIAFPPKENSKSSTTYTTESNLNLDKDNFCGSGEMPFFQNMVDIEMALYCAISIKREYFFREVSTCLG